MTNQDTLIYPKLQRRLRKLNVLDIAQEEFEPSALSSPSSKAAETEITVYAMCSAQHYSGLSEAKSVEVQIQVEGAGCNKEASDRCRASLSKQSSGSAGVQYTYTLKTRENAGVIEHCTEHNVKIDQDFFHAWSKRASHVLYKTRYTFSGIAQWRKSAYDGHSSPDYVEISYLKAGEQVPDDAVPVWIEVDLFGTQGASEISPWCKIDVELQDFIKDSKERIVALGNPALRIELHLSQLPIGLSQYLQSHESDSREKIEQLWKSFKQPIAQVRHMLKGLAS